MCGMRMRERDPLHLDRPRCKYVFNALHDKRPFMDVLLPWMNGYKCIPIALSSRFSPIDFLFRLSRACIAKLDSGNCASLVSRARGESDFCVLHHSEGSSENKYAHTHNFRARQINKTFPRALDFGL
jgi:hypothetical protein